MLPQKISKFLTARNLNIFFIVAAAVFLYAAASDIIKIGYGKGDEASSVALQEKKMEQYLLIKNQESITKLIDALSDNTRMNNQRDSVYLSIIKVNNGKISSIQDKGRIQASDRAIDSYGSDELKRKFSDIR